MINIEKYIFTIQNYPDDGKHQECKIGLPFEIRKGEDGYFWVDKNGKEQSYNIFKSDKIDSRWIVHLDKNSYINPSLNKIFEIKVNKDLDKIIDYCVFIYVKSCKLEIKRLQNEILRYK